MLSHPIGMVAKVMRITKKDLASENITINTTPDNVQTYIHYQSNINLLYHNTEHNDSDDSKVFSLLNMNMKNKLNDMAGKTDI